MVEQRLCQQHGRTNSFVNYRQVNKSFAQRKVHSHKRRTTTRIPIVFHSPTLWLGEIDIVRQAISKHPLSSRFYRHRRPQAPIATRRISCFGGISIHARVRYFLLAFWEGQFAVFGGMDFLAFVSACSSSPPRLFLFHRRKANRIARFLKASNRFTTKNGFHSANSGIQA